MEFKDREDYEKNVGFIYKDNCIFCSKDLEKTNKIIHKTKYWIIMYNKYPYFGEEKHLLVLPKIHKEFSYELSEEIFWDIINVEKFMKDFYWEIEYFSFIRQTFWNRSIAHLHYHYLSWRVGARLIDKQRFLKIKDY